MKLEYTIEQLLKASYIRVNYKQLEDLWIQINKIDKEHKKILGWLVDKPTNSILQKKLYWQQPVEVKIEEIEAIM